jgi:hypothetical protein
MGSLVAMTSAIAADQTLLPDSRTRAIPRLEIAAEHLEAGDAASGSSHQWVVVTAIRSQSLSRTTERPLAGWIIKTQARPEYEHGLRSSASICPPASSQVHAMLVGMTSDLVLIERGLLPARTAWIDVIGIQNPGNPLFHHQSVSRSRAISEALPQIRAGATRPGPSRAARVAAWCRVLRDAGPACRTALEAGSLGV